ncbi:carboxypeptidase-like regulatory domain-containing protein [Flavobacteriaceae bacterium]|nr:carboxypeptidase-like regulatory domain-containing protein [Flavobacteriaceae bacterium]
MFAFLLCIPVLNAQFILQGRIIDALTKEPLPFVNIGILKKELGTVSNEDGFFFLEVPDVFAKETLRFSMIGFDERDFQVADLEAILLSNNTLVLAEQTTFLEEVVLTAEKKWDTRVSGNTTTSKLLITGFTSNQLGNEIALFIKVKKTPAYIEGIQFSVVENIYPEVRFRVNVYSSEYRFPDENILKENIFVTLKQSEGIISVDLKEYDILIDDDVFISLEWIDEDLGSEGLWFSAGVFGKSIYARSTSQAEWKKQRGLSLGMSVTLKEASK